MSGYQLSRTLRAARDAGRIALLADVKCRSPRDGQLIPTEKVEDYVRALLEGPVDAIATVTEPVQFGGSLQIAQRIRAFVDHARASRGAAERRRSRGGFPLVRKEFFTGVEQMDESKASGFDAVHLTLRTIGDLDLVRRMKARAEELGMEAVIGVHDGAEMEQALRLGATIVGINNRDILQGELDDGTVTRTEQMMAIVPREVLVISESGLLSREDVVRAGRAGAAAVLIGTAIAKSPDPAAMVRVLRGDPPLPPVAERRT
jgi:indole-3-glycerol phosphate synthase